MIIYGKSYISIISRVKDHFAYLHTFGKAAKIVVTPAKFYTRGELEFVRQGTINTGVIAGKPVLGVWVNLRQNLIQYYTVQPNLRVQINCTNAGIAAPATSTSSPVEKFLENCR
jgi:hypothetical protein